MLLRECNHILTLTVKPNLLPHTVTETEDITSHLRGECSCKFSNKLMKVEDKPAYITFLFVENFALHCLNMAWFCRWITAAILCFEKFKYVWCRHMKPISIFSLIDFCFCFFMMISGWRWWFTLASIFLHVAVNRRWGQRVRGAEDALWCPDWNMKS